MAPKTLPSSAAFWRNCADRPASLCPAITRETAVNQLKIATRLMLLGGLMTGFLIFIAGLGLYGTGATHNALKTVYENRTIPAGQLGSIDASVLEGRLMIALALANPTPEAIQANTARLEASSPASTTPGQPTWPPP